MTLSIAPAPPSAPDAVRLLAQADARSAALYPAESRRGLSPEALVEQNARFFIACLDGRPLGCAGYVPGAAAAELKRLFVAAEARGQGIGHALVCTAERAAATEHFRCMQLETGVKSAEALRLYARIGYHRRGPFGAYAPDPLSVFMEKRLDPAIRGHPGRQLPA